MQNFTLYYFEPHVYSRSLSPGDAGKRRRVRALSAGFTASATRALPPESSHVELAPSFR
jgi:hypothetical protein